MDSYVNFPLYVRNIWPCFLADDRVFMMTQKKALMILQLCSRYAFLLDRLCVTITSVCLCIKLLGHSQGSSRH